MKRTQDNKQKVTARPNQGLASDVKRNSETQVKQQKEYDGDISTVISTGSTLLDLAISGGRIRVYSDSDKFSHPGRRKAITASTGTPCRSKSATGRSRPEASTR